MYWAAMTLLLLSADLMCSSRVCGAAERIGSGALTASSTAMLLEQLPSESLTLVVLDLNTPGLDVSELVPQVRRAAPSLPILAFGPHVHSQRLQAASESGCDLVVSRGQFHAQMDEILTRLAQGDGSQRGQDS